MNHFLVFAFIASATADQSSYEAGVSKVLDSLEQVVLSGDNAATGDALGRKLYVQQILKVALKSPALSTAAKGHLLTAKIKLQNVLACMRTATGNDQTTVNDIRMAFDHCADAWSVATGHGAYNTAHNNAVSSASSAHATCRRQEEVDIGEVQTACATFQTNANARSDDDSGATYDCASGIAESDLVGDARTEGIDGVGGVAKDYYYGLWNTWFTNQQAHYAVTTLIGEVTACEARYAEWGLKNGITQSPQYPLGSCGCLQLAYEQAFCARKVQFTIRCEQNYACHAYYNNEYATTHAQIQLDEAQRLRDAAMITYAICLLDTMANDSQNNTIEDIDAACNGYLDDDYSADYGNNFTALPSAEHADNCTDQTWYTETDPSNANAWYSKIKAEVEADGSTFTGPFRVPTPGLCSAVFSYASRGPAYYIRVTDGDNNEYWHNETLVGATPDSLPR